MTRFELDDRLCLQGSDAIVDYADIGNLDIISIIIICAKINK